MIPRKTLFGYALFIGTAKIQSAVFIYFLRGAAVCCSTCLLKKLFVLVTHCPVVIIFRLGILSTTASAPTPDASTIIPTILLTLIHAREAGSLFVAPGTNTITEIPFKRGASLVASRLGRHTG
jgi:hypothetical protein